MAQRLRQISEHLAAGRVDLLGQQSKVRGTALEHAVRLAPGRSRIAEERKRLHEPKAASGERAFVFLHAGISVDRLSQGYPDACRL
jgi:hypothetical protein